MVFGYVGYATPAIDELTDVLHAALAKQVASGRRRCDVRFLARAGEFSSERMAERVANAWRGLLASDPKTY